jgi:hypothetical protein
MGRSHRVGTERNAQEEGDKEVYETPPEALLALMGVEALPQVIWEPACGSGQIVDVLRESGRIVIASDIRDTECEGMHVRDFLKCEQPPTGWPKGHPHAIVTNPPFSLMSSGEWVKHSLALAPDIYLLGRINVLAGVRRTEMIEQSGLRRIYVFRERLPMMHKAGFLEAGGKASTSTIDFAWFCWRKGWKGLAAVKRISWRNPKPALPPFGVKPPKTYCPATPDMFPAEVA